MKTEKMTKIALAVVVVLGLSGSLWAGWSAPVPVLEVNTAYRDSAPFLSFDGLTLYFVRANTDTFSYARIFQATRPVPSGPFTSVDEISTLNYSGGDLWAPWVSSDNLRMYYSRTEPGNIQRLKVSERASTSVPWPTGINISELNALGKVCEPSLTSNELIIVFWGYDLPGNQGAGDIWIATRPDISLPFENIRNLSELNTVFDEGYPFISSDGLTLLFHSNRNGIYQLFKATRASLIEPFGNLEHLSFFDTPAGDSGAPCLSYDGTALYFVSWLSDGNRDIYVSYLDSYAFNPNPADGAVIPGDIYEDNIWTMLVFVPGATAIKHTGYFSDNYDDVAGRIEDANLGSPPYGHIAGWEYTFFAGHPAVPPAVETLVRGVTYYWCVDETDALGTTYPGAIWEFTVQDYKACCPNPPDGAVVSGPDVLLSWVPGFGAEEHDVYMGTSWEDVNNAVYDPFTPPPEFLATRSEPNILVTGLAENTWYYWRVDEIIGRGPPFFIAAEFYKGDVWSFNTGTGGGLHVPSQYATIQAAINAAVNGEEVIVADGTYTGVGNKNLDFGGRAITVRSVNGPEFTIIDCENQDRGFLFRSGEGEDSILAGFTIRNGNANSISPESNNGGAILCLNSSPKVRNCVLRNNTTSGRGGGIYCSVSSMVLSECKFMENTTDVAGGGLHSNNSTLEISNCEFLNNSCVGFSSDGGGIDQGNGSNCTIINCLFAGNTCLNDGAGAGIRNYNASGILINCTFTGNSAQYGGICNSPTSSPIYMNCILWGNSGYEIYNNGDSHPTFSNCDIEGGWNGPQVINLQSSSVIDGGGNIAADPLFIDAINPDFYARNYRLSDGSACINAGDNSAVPVQVTTDLAGNPRIIDGVVDMGAYEAEYYGPIAHWKFDEGSGSVAYDSAGNNDGIISGAAWSTGIIDGALDFDGVDDYVDVGNDSSLMTTGDLTIIAWIKALESRACIYSHTWNGWRLGFGIGNDNYDGRLGFYTWNHHQWIKAGSSLADDIWHHVAVTLSGTMVTLYTDGIEIGGDTGAPASDLTGIGLIGLYNYDWHFGGLLDDIRIYDRALSAGEIMELYNSVPVPPVGDTYHVDGVNGSDLNDGLTKETAFATIQKGINSSDDGDTVLVWPGVYNEAATQGINFKGKAITVTSAADAAVLKVPGYTAVTFAQGEDGNSVFSNFVVRGSDTGILALFANPTISNVTIVDNDNGIIADNADPEITNCIFWNNFNGDLFGSPDPIEARYSWLEDDVNEPNMPPAGLVSHWKFNEGGGLIAYDSAGNNDAVVFGAAWTTSPFGNALDFDGVDDYVDCGNDKFSTLNEGTISAWVKFVDGSSFKNILTAKEGADTRDYFVFRIHDQKLGLALERPSPTDFIIRSYGTTTLQANTWYHVVYATDSSGNIFYINGNPEVMTYTSGSSTSNVFFGDLPSGQVNAIGILRNYDGSDIQSFDGIIDEVGIYNRALSAEEIEQIYEPVPNPLFADAAGGDYHLKSERGRYWPAHDVWVLDDETSPCIDGGDPGIGPMNEPMPNGGRINMGAYGNTAYASMSECRGKADINCDGIVNFKDLAFLAQFWLEE